MTARLTPCGAEGVHQRVELADLDPGQVSTSGSSPGIALALMRHGDDAHPCAGAAVRETTGKLPLPAISPIVSRLTPCIAARRTPQRQMPRFESSTKLTKRSTSGDGPQLGADLGDRLGDLEARTEKGPGRRA